VIDRDRHTSAVFRPADLSSSKLLSFPRNLLVTKTIEIFAIWHCTPGEMAIMIIREGIRPSSIVSACKGRRGYDKKVNRTDADPLCDSRASPGSRSREGPILEF
jgi:hypothetical protein